MPKPKNTSTAAVAFPERDSVSRFAHVLATSGLRLAQLQNEAVDLAFEEIAQRHRAWLENVGRGAEMLSWPAGNGERMSALMQEWLGVVTQAQAAWLEAMVNSLPSARMEMAEGEVPFVDRRVRSIVINFPDRRLAA